MKLPYRDWCLVTGETQTSDTSIKELNPEMQTPEPSAKHPERGTKNLALTFPICSSWGFGS